MKNKRAFTLIELIQLICFCSLIALVITISAHFIIKFW